MDAFLSRLRHDSVPGSTLPSQLVAVLYAIAVLAENRFLAARDGIAANLIDERAGALRPALDALTELLDGCRHVAGRLGCSSELARAAALVRDPGAARQRRHVRLAGLNALPSWLAEQFAPTAQLTAAA